MNIILKSALAVGLLAGMTAASQAETLAQAFKTGSQSGTDTAFVAVELKNNGAKNLSFNAPTPGFYYFTYNAECSAGSQGGWVSVQIVVDGNKIAKPASGTDFALCTGGTEGTRYVGATRTGYANVTAGNHTVQVQVARRSGPAGATWRLDDSLLTVTD